MPRSSVVPRSTLQTSRTGQKHTSRLSSSGHSAPFTKSDRDPTGGVTQSTDPVSVKDDLDEVPDSQPPGSQSMYCA